jgi:hypothetical protein
MVKTVLQTLLIASMKTIYRHYKFLHALLFLLFWTLFIVFNLQIKAFNYARTTHWNRVGFFAVQWLVVLAILDSVAEPTLAFVIVLLVGWFTLLLVGFYIQSRKFPEMLIQPKGHPIDFLLRFSLRPNTAESLEIFRLRESTIKN